MLARSLQQLRSIPTDPRPSSPSASKNVNAELPSTDPERELSDPDDERVRCAATDDGFYHSPDAARTWNRRAITGAGSSPTVAAAASHPEQGGTIIATVDETGVFRTEDGGETWTEVQGTNDLLGLPVDIVLGSPATASVGVQNQGLFRIGDM